jgi:hypothetical protein
MIKRTSHITTFSNVTEDPQTPFDVAVVIPTILRDSLPRALDSVYRQDFKGRIQILVGIDKPLGCAKIDSGPLPENCVLSFIDFGYSTSVRHGGLHSAEDGGVLRCVLTYLANSRFVAYLDDDNWWAADHLSSLCEAIEGKHWSYSLRWYVHSITLQPIWIDYWESVGPDRGCFAPHFGGYVDANCLLIDKFACEELLRLWNFPLFGDPRGQSADRSFFSQLRLLPSRCTAKATSLYVADPKDLMHPLRLQWLGRSYDEAGVEGAPFDAQIGKNSDEIWFGRQFFALAAEFEDVDGFLHPEEGYALYNWSRYWPGIGVVLEIGSDFGRTTCWLAASARESAAGKVIAVGQFQGSRDDQKVEDCDSDTLIKNGTAFDNFDKTIKRKGLADWVDIRTGASPNVPREGLERVRLLFLNGCHGYDALNGDMAEWIHNVETIGAIAIHEVGVRAGATKFYKEFIETNGAVREVYRRRSLRIVAAR